MDLLKDELIVRLQKPSICCCNPGNYSVEVKREIARFSFMKDGGFSSEQNTSLLNTISTILSNYPDLIISYGRTSNLFTKKEIEDYMCNIRMYETKVDECAQTMFEFHDNVVCGVLVDIMADRSWKTYHKKKKINTNNLCNMLDNLQVFLKDIVDYTDELLADIKLFEEKLANNTSSKKED